jgi:hypothetical protein
MPISRYCVNRLRAVSDGRGAAPGRPGRTPVGALGTAATGPVRLLVGRSGMVARIPHRRRWARAGSVLVGADDAGVDGHLPAQLVDRSTITPTSPTSVVRCRGVLNARTGCRRSSGAVPLGRVPPRPPGPGLEQLPLITRRSSTRGRRPVPDGAAAVRSPATARRRSGGPGWPDPRRGGRDSVMGDHSYSVCTDALALTHFRGDPASGSGRSAPGRPPPATSRRSAPGDRTKITL